MDLTRMDLDMLQEEPGYRYYEENRKVLEGLHEDLLLTPHLEGVTVE